METYEFSQGFQLGSLIVSPVHVRLERLRPVIAAHRHSNVSYEIHYTSRGHGTVTIDEITRRVEPGTLYITGPGIVHAQFSETADPVTEYCLYLNCRRNPHADDDRFALFAQTAFWMGKDNGSISNLLMQLIEENRASLSGTAEMSECLVKQVIIQLTRIYLADNTPTLNKVHAPALTRAGLMPVIEDAFFYRYKGLTLQELAGLLNLSIRQTQRLLQHSFGKTFSQKLTEARVAAAAQLLINTDLSITRISEKAGFSSIEHFSATFHRSTGIAPREYRKKHRSVIVAGSTISEISEEL